MGAGLAFCMSSAVHSRSCSTWWAPKPKPSVSSLTRSWLWSKRFVAVWVPFRASVPCPAAFRRAGGVISDPLTAPPSRRCRPPRPREPP
ncbi:hypothetical protein GQS52_04265 [Streptomyces sp. SCUT-3]|uniref:hypothetical protein n=1 Tax=Streptomyces sp. SCUT-3 TaxID=2684469 RepID=UPI000CB8F46F|nr:hypothetical protein [Streptomyces sp. SCUT-3]PLW72866.1 hypothetical protein C0036_10300 [Streptomyces sp. DJ]QMV21113.1 hypothetical protein GQS52_04265 [Streptomyces sp. SCUT-3]